MKYLKTFDNVSNTDYDKYFLINIKNKEDIKIILFMLKINLTEEQHDEAIEKLEHISLMTDVKKMDGWIYIVFEKIPRYDQIFEWLFYTKSSIDYLKKEYPILTYCGEIKVTEKDRERYELSKILKKYNL